MAAEARVFDGNRLRASLFAAGGEAGLYVTFRHRVEADGDFSPARPVRHALAAGFAHLHIQSRRNDWFVNPETADLEAALAALAPAYARKRALGLSMGGYGALRFAGVLGLERAVAVSPQVSIHPAEVPWDPRYHADAGGWKAALGDLARHPAPGLTGAVLVDPSRPLDLRHARLAAGLFPGLALCRLGFGGHPAAQVLNEAVGIGRLHALLLAGEDSRARLTALHRGARRQSDRYRARLDRALAARAGR